MTNLSGANLNNGAAVGPLGEGRESPSSFPAYTAYKDSGVEWLGGLPQHWRFGCLKHALIELISGGTPESGNPAYWADGDGVPWVAISDMTKGLVINDTAKTITEDGLKSKGLRVIPAGGLLYSIYASIGKVAVLGLSAVTNQAILGLVVNGAVADQQFVRWWLVSLEGWVKTVSSSNTQDNLNAEKVRNLPLAFPSLTEQTQIARFLDHETARIDALIEEQQRLIELLKEKRQAVISHAVTKGLDPTVPMKDSGVEWLGEVPAHWDVTRSKFVFRLVSGYAFKSEFFQKNGDGEKILITPGSFDEFGRLYFSEKSTVQYEGEWQAQFELKVGDLVMVLTDLSYKKLILGRAAFVERDDALLNQRIAKVIIAPRVKANYLWLGINSEVMREQLKLTASGATVFHTSPEKVGDCWMALPPCEEQLEITAFVEEFHLKLDTLIQQVRDTVGLLTERRSALISAAVTGKIDVRGWQPSASAQAPKSVQEAV